MRILLAGLGAAALVAIVVIGLLSAGGGGAERSGSHLTVPEAKRALAGAPGPLGDLYARANELIGGGPDAFRRRLRSLRGRPVVVNKWASWCGPCRSEFPYFQRLATKYGARIGFIGVDAADNDGDARRFLREFPLPYPSFRDPDSKIARVFHGVAAFPTTVFYDARGELSYLKQGAYLSEAKLEADIRRYTR